MNETFTSESQHESDDIIEHDQQALEVDDVSLPTSTSTKIAKALLWAGYLLEPLGEIYNAQAADDGALAVLLVYNLMTPTDKQQVPIEFTILFYTLALPSTISAWLEISPNDPETLSHVEDMLKIKNIKLSRIKFWVKAIAAIYFICTGLRDALPVIGWVDEANVNENTKKGLIVLATVIPLALTSIHNIALSTGDLLTTIDLFKNAKTKLLPAFYHGGFVRGVVFFFQNLIAHVFAGINISYAFRDYILQVGQQSETDTVIHSVIAILILNVLINFLIRFPELFENYYFQDEMIITRSERLALEAQIPIFNKIWHMIKRKALLSLSWALVTTYLLCQIDNFILPVAIVCGILTYLLHGYVQHGISLDNRVRLNKQLDVELGIVRSHSNEHNLEHVDSHKFDLDFKGVMVGLLINLPKQMLILLANTQYAIGILEDYFQIDRKVIVTIALFANFQDRVTDAIYIQPKLAGNVAKLFRSQESTATTPLLTPTTSTPPNESKEDNDSPRSHLAQAKFTFFKANEENDLTEKLLNKNQSQSSRCVIL